MSGKGEYSQLISVKDFKRQFIDSLEPKEYERKRKEIEPETMEKEMGVPLETVNDLIEVCR